MLRPIFQLIPHLQRLQNALIPEMGDPKYHSTRSYLEMLPYSFGAAQYAFLEGIRAQHEVVGEAAQQLDKKTRLVPKPDQRDRLAYPIDSFLDAARRTQNAIVHYISRAQSVSLKSSLNDVMKDIYSGKVKLGFPLDQILTDYWTRHGKRLKEYRDLSQHHAIVSSHVQIFTSSSGEPGFYMTLPNNPEVKDLGKLEWGNPPIHTYLYVRLQLIELIRFAYHVTRYLVEQFPEKRNPDGTFTLTLRPQLFNEPIKMGAGSKTEGQRLFDAESINKVLDQLPLEFEKQYISNMEKAKTSE